LFIQIVETYTPSIKMLNKDRLKARQSDFKKGIDLEEGRKKREEITVSIRKKNKAEQVNKRRNISLPTFQGVDPRPADPAALETVSKN
jgi:importin subunit alpha-1